MRAREPAGLNHWSMVVARAFIIVPGYGANNVVLTIYNCGTNYSRKKKDLIGLLYRITSSRKFITDGPGTQSNPATRKMGEVTGKGVKANVNAAVEQVKDFSQQSRSPVTVNLVGWSRGAITCFKIANKLSNSKEPWTDTVTLNVFAVDPVPGPAAFGSREMWQGIRVTDNINDGLVLHAVHESRWYMPGYSPGGVNCETMPGNHAALVEGTDDFAVVHEIVRDRAVKFLSDKGTRFSPLAVHCLLSDVQIIERYAKTYATLPGGKTTVGKRPLYFRPKQGEKGNQVRRVSRAKPAFFFNDHHRVAFRRVLPATADEISRSRNPMHKLRSSTSLLRELDKLDRPMYENTRAQVYNHFNFYAG